MNKHILILMLSLGVYCQASNASLIGTDAVDGRNSLYATNWGHPYNTGSGNEFNALHRGNPASAFGVGGDAYEFLSGERLNITASGCVVDSGSSCTEPDYMGGDFRGLPVYSLIGVWSSDENEIIPLLASSLNQAFLIGSFLDVIVPSFVSPIYLFMATNDGIFSDNSNAYSVRIEKLAQVSSPSVLWLMLFGLLFKTKWMNLRLRREI